MRGELRVRQASAGNQRNRCHHRSTFQPSQLHSYATSVDLDLCPVRLGCRLPDCACIAIQVHSHIRSAFPSGPRCCKVLGQLRWGTNRSQDEKSAPIGRRTPGFGVRLDRGSVAYTDVKEWVADRLVVLLTDGRLRLREATSVRASELRPEAVSHFGVGAAAAPNAASVRVR